MALQIKNKKDLAEKRSLEMQVEQLTEEDVKYDGVRPHKNLRTNSRSGEIRMSDSTTHLLDGRVKAGENQNLDGVQFQNAV